MGSPFTNSIIGGGGSLVRQQIKSPDYVAGVSGWIIRKDGSAEFNDATFRGTIIVESENALLAYDGTPGAGNLFASIAAENFGDEYGNAIIKGVTTYDLGNGHIPLGAQLVLANAPGSAECTINFNATDALLKVTTNGSGIQLRTGAIGVAIESGLFGMYYFEQVIPNYLANIPSGATFNTLTNLNPAELISDYGSAFNLATGVWTAPVTGIYTVTFGFCFAAWVTGSRLLQGINLNGTALANIAARADIVPAGSIGQVAPLCMRRYLQNGDTLTFSVGQTTGANQVATHDARSFITIQREI